MPKTLPKVRGLTLIELMVALVVSAFLISILYRTFIGQQRMYVVQEQVADMRQNGRGAISNMIREIRMTGFGRVEMILPATFGSGTSAVTYRNVVNSNTPSEGLISIVTAIDSDRRSTTLKEESSGKTLTVRDLSYFDMDTKKYISIGGIESNTIVGIDTDKKQLSLKERLIYRHPKDTWVYPIRAITYEVDKGRLYRDENTLGPRQPVTEENTIESIEYEYLDSQGHPTVHNAAIRMIKVTVIAKTDQPDPQFKGGDGYRRRQISSNVQLRNVEFRP